MKQKNLIVLGGITAAVLVAAAFAVKERSPSNAAQDEERGALFEGLKGRVNDLGQVALHKGGESLTIKLENGNWSVVERSGYPAKFDKVKQAIVTAAELEIEEPKTKKPERWAQLGVEDPSAEDSESTRLVLSDKSGAVVADLVIGDPLFRTGSDESVYVRRADEDQVYLCTGRFDLSATPMDWVERNVLAVQAREVTAVSLEHADGESFTIEATEPNGVNFQLQSVPSGREAKERAGDPIASAFASVYLDDVRPLDEIDFSAEPLLNGTWKTADGEVISATIAKFEDKHWVRFSFAYESPPAPAGPTSEEEQAAADAAAALELTTRKRVDERNTDLTPWAFAIPSYKAEGLAKRIEDLLIPLEPADVGPSPEEATPGLDSPEMIPSQGEFTEGDDEPVEAPITEEETGDGSDG